MHESCLSELEENGNDGKYGNKGHCLRRRRLAYERTPVRYQAIIPTIPATVAGMELEWDLEAVLLLKVEVDVELADGVVGEIREPLKVVSSGYTLSAMDVEPGNLAVVDSMSTKELLVCPTETGVVLKVESGEIGVVEATLSVSAVVLAAELEAVSTVCNVSVAAASGAVVFTESTGTVVFAVVAVVSALVVFCLTVDVVLLLLSSSEPPLFGRPLDPPPSLPLPLPCP